MKNKLKPCPFCGYDEITEKDIKETYPSFGTKVFSVWCWKCGAMGGVSSGEDVAIKKWNRRADDGRE